MDLSVTQASFTWDKPVERTYVYADGTRETFGGVIRMDVAKTGCHVMQSVDGTVFIVAPGYRYIVQRIF